MTNKLRHLHVVLRSHRGSIILAAATMAALAIHALWYRPFFCDDGFISLRYAQRLLHGHGLTWDDYERVEGYTNFLWTVGCGVFGVLCRDLVAGARVLGVLSACGAQCALLYVHWRPTWRGGLPGTIGAALIAASGPVAVWAIGGLEQTLLSALLAWGIALLCTPGASPKDPGRGRLGWVGDRRDYFSSLALALACVTRADALLLVGCILGAFILAHAFSRAALVHAARMALMPGAFVLVQALARRAYYGEWVPNSAWAKLAFTSHRLHDGFAYLHSAFDSLGVLLVPIPLAMIAAAVDRGRRARLVVLLLTTTVWLAYVAVIGGDIFPARRHLVVCVVLLAFVAADVFATLMTWGLHYLLGASAGAALVIALASSQFNDAENARALNERWEWDARPVGEMLSRGFARQQPLVAVDAAGALPFFSELPSLDMLGLNDRYLAHHRPPSFGDGQLGHELGDGRYVLARKPDIVIFGVPTGDAHAPFVGGQQMEADANFALLYQLVTFETAAPERLTCRAWVRREDSSIGIARTGDVVRVPAYFASNERAPAQLHANGFVVIVSQDKPGTLVLDLTPGRWRMAMADSPLELAVASPSGALRTMGINEFTIDISGAGQAITFELRPRRAMLAQIGDVSFHREALP